MHIDKENKQAKISRPINHMNKKARKTSLLIASLLLVGSNLLLTGCDSNLEKEKNKVALNNGINHVAKEKETKKQAALSSIIDNYLKEDYDKTLIDTDNSKLSSKDAIQEYVSTYSFGVNEVFANVDASEKTDIMRKYQTYTDDAVAFGYKYHFNKDYYKNFTNGMFKYFELQSKTFKNTDGPKVRKDLAALSKKLKEKLKELKKQEEPSYSQVAEVGYLRELNYAYRTLYADYNTIYSNADDFLLKLQSSKQKDEFNSIGYDMYYRLLTLKHASYDSSYKDTNLVELNTFGDISKIKYIHKYFNDLLKTDLDNLNSDSKIRKAYYTLQRYHDYLGELAINMRIYGTQLPNNFQEYYLSYISNLQLYSEPLLSNFVSLSDDTLGILKDTEKPTDALLSDIKVILKIFNKYYDEIESAHKKELDEIKKEEIEKEKAKAKAREEKEAVKKTIDEKGKNASSATTEKSKGKSETLETESKETDSKDKKTRNTVEKKHHQNESEKQTTPVSPYDRDFSQVHSSK